MNRRDLAWGGTLAAIAAFAGAYRQHSGDGRRTGDVLAAIEEYRKAMVDGNGARLLGNVCRRHVFRPCQWRGADQG